MKQKDKLLKTVREHFFKKVVKKGTPYFTGLTCEEYGEKKPKQFVLLRSIINHGKGMIKVKDLSSSLRSWVQQCSSAASNIIIEII